MTDCTITLSPYVTFGTAPALTTAVLRRSHLLTLTILAAFGVAGCNDAVARVESSEPAPVETAAPAASSANAGHGKGKPKAQRNARRGRMPAVFVDGEMVGVLKFQELPPQMPVHWTPRGEMVVDRRFKISDFLEAVGVNLAEVKALHIYGGKRVSVVSGDEFRAKKDNMQFRFTRDVSGRPAYKYVGHIETNTAIEKITRLAVYVNKPVPELLRGWPALDGKRVESGVPYADAKVLKDKGTRVYLDGKYMGVIKRRHVKNAESNVLADLLRDELDIDVASVKRAHFVGSRDALAKTVVGNDQFVDAALKVSAKRNGRVSVETVADGRAVDAIILFAKVEHVDRAIDPPEKFKVPGELPHVDDAVGPSSNAPKKVK